MTRFIIAFFLVFFISNQVHAQAAPPPSSSPLQRIIDACAEDTVCNLPNGRFVITESLRITKPIQLVGRGRGLGILRFRPFTEIQVAQPGGASPSIPAILVLTGGDVGIRNLGTVGGGIRVGRNNDPCRGIDDPDDTFPARVELNNLWIRTGEGDGVQFSGDSVTAEDVVINNVAGTGFYIANAPGDIVLQNNSFANNDGWGVYICNLQGSGEIFINNLSTNVNGHGGIAIVGRGGPAPDERRVCMQNTRANFNFRVGVLLFEVAPALLFNVRAGINFSDPNGVFGDGISVSSSDEVYFWDVTTVLNNRAGYSIFETDPNEETVVHLLGEFNALNNTININGEGPISLNGHSSPTVIGPFCGFSELTAPPFEDHCEEDFQEDVCAIRSSTITPPPHIPPTVP